MTPFTDLQARCLAAMDAVNSDMGETGPEHEIEVVPQTQPVRRPAPSPTPAPTPQPVREPERVPAKR